MLICCDTVQKAALREASSHLCKWKDHRGFILKQCPWKKPGLLKFGGFHALVLLMGAPFSSGDRVDPSGHGPSLNLILTEG